MCQCKFEISNIIRDQMTDFSMNEIVLWRSMMNELWNNHKTDKYDKQTDFKLTKFPIQIINWEI